MPVARPLRVLPRGYQEVFAHQAFRRFIPAVAASERRRRHEHRRCCMARDPGLRDPPWARTSASLSPRTSRSAGCAAVHPLDAAPAGASVVACGCVSAGRVPGGCPDRLDSGETSPSCRHAARRFLVAARVGRRPVRPCRQLLPNRQRLAGNALVAPSVWASTVVGPLLAGVSRRDGSRLDHRARRRVLRLPSDPGGPHSGSGRNPILTLAHARLRDGLRVGADQPSSCSVCWR